MSKALDELRKQIDTLDNAIHDLLMKRADLIAHIGEEKRKNKLQMIQPAREALMIRRLLARHAGPLPEPAVVRIWRELVGAVSLLQTGLKVTVTAEEGREGLWDMARDYFGSVLPMQKVGNPLNAFSMVREGEANFAVLPWPRDSDENPWWMYLLNPGMNGADPIRIVTRLPYGDYEGDHPDPANQGLVVARIKFESTGSDRSFIILELEPSISRGRIVDVAKSVNMTPLSLHTRKNAAPDVRPLHILEVSEYISTDDPRLKTILEKLEDPQGRCTCVGGYPVPPVYVRKDYVTGKRIDQSGKTSSAA